MPCPGRSTEAGRRRRAARGPTRGHAAAPSPGTMPRAAPRPSRPRPEGRRSPARNGHRTGPAQVASGVASTNCPSHQDRSPRPDGGAATTPSRSIAASHSCGASTATEASSPVRSGLTQDSARDAIRPHERRLRQRGEQFGRGRADVAAAVGERLFQEGLVHRGEPGAQRVEEHQPVLGPLGGPGGREQHERRYGIVGPNRPEQGDPLGEQSLLPQPGDRFRLRRVGQRRAAGRTAQRELPLGVQPRQPQSARPGEGQGLRPQIRTGPGRVEQGREQRGRGPETLLVGGGQPLRDQLREIGRRAPTAAQ